MNFTDSLKFFLPEVFLLIGALMAFTAHFFVKNRKAIGFFALFVIIGSIFLSRPAAGTMLLFFGFFTLDPLTHFFRILILGATAVSLCGALAYDRLDRHNEAPFYVLFLLLAFALILLAGATNLLTLFLAAEFIALSCYLLTAFLKKDRRAQEAAAKYFLSGTLATGIMLYGISLIYGAAGSLDFSVILKTTVALKFGPMMTFGLLLFLTGLGYKIAVVPFHFTSLDVYEAAPTPLSALLSAAPKAAAFAVLIRLLLVPFLSVSHHWQPLMIVLAIVTMTLGNLVAVSQVNIKRLLAYSCLAQTGYMLVGLAAPSSTGMDSILINLAALGLTNLGAFLVVISVSNAFGDDDLQSYAGLSKKSPPLALCLTVFLLSLTGLPPTAGFVAKWFVLSTTIETGFHLLTAAVVLNSVLAAYYYFKIIKIMYILPAIDEEPAQGFGWQYLVIGLLVAAVVATGLYPSLLIDSVKGIFP